MKRIAAAALVGALLAGLSGASSAQDRTVRPQSLSGCRMHAASAPTVSALHGPLPRGLKPAPFASTGDGTIGTLTSMTFACGGDIGFSLPTADEPPEYAEDWTSLAVVPPKKLLTDSVNDYQFLLAAYSTNLKGMGPSRSCAAPGFVQAPIDFDAAAEATEATIYSVTGGGAMARSLITRVNGLYEEDFQQSTRVFLAVEEEVVYFDVNIESKKSRTGTGELLDRSTPFVGTALHADETSFNFIGRCNSQR